MLMAKIIEFDKVLSIEVCRRIKESILKIYNKIPVEEIKNFSFLKLFDFLIRHFLFYYQNNETKTESIESALDIILRSDAFFGSYYNEVREVLVNHQEISYDLYKTLDYVYNWSTLNLEDIDKHRQLVRITIDEDIVSATFKEEYLNVSRLPY